jgi:putative NADH-flavin reductase
MNLTIIAATGGVGRELLRQGVAAGHDVAAVVRNPDKLSRQVRVVPADLAAPSQAALESAVAGADAGWSVRGPMSPASCSTCSASPGTIQQAIGIAS